MRSVTAEDQARPDVELRRVDAFLEQYDAKLREYLSGPAWSEFWKAPSSVDGETSQFINSLRIPKIGKRPMLVLHDLGGGIVDPAVVDRVFASQSA